MVTTGRSLLRYPSVPLICILSWTAFDHGAAGAESPAGSAVDLVAGFGQPPDAAKPWAYWWWVNGNVTEASITRDLEQMKAKGFIGFLMFDSRNYHDDNLPPPPPPMEFMSDRWRALLKFAMSEAERLGLQMSVNLSSGAGALKGPWDVGDQAPKQMLWTSSEVRGPRRVNLELPRPERQHFWDVAVVAARLADSPAGNAAAEPAAVPAARLAGPWQEVQAKADPKRVADEVLDLTAQVDAQGRLQWDAPAGNWTVFRFAGTTIPGHEHDADILSVPAVTAHFQRLGQALLSDAGPRAGKTLTHFYSVSWEGAAPTWTLGLDQEFQERRGYALRAWLPVLAGVTVKSPEASRRFERDFHKTLGDLFMDHCYGTLRKLCHQHGLQWHSESGGPWNRQLPDFQHADQLAFLGRNDMPQGEFWHPNRALNRPSAMASHIYGLPLAATEAFTHMRPHWSVYPAVLKPDADAAFCDGINHFIWHTFTASPVEFGQPGIEYFAGSHVNPNVTWFEQAGAFLRYLARCQLLLRQGKFVADVCTYTGDKPYLHWGRGTKWSEQATLDLPSGYTFDLLSSEVLLNRLSVQAGELVLPDGMRYRALVLDLEDEAVPPEALRKIVDLAGAGATIILGRRRPTRAPGLTEYPACDDDVRRLATELWGAGPAGAASRACGQGRILTGSDLETTLATLKIAPDYEGPWPYIHRRSGDLDIYFLAGAGEAECTFRVSGREPELWDPVTGQICDAAAYRSGEDGRTIVPIQLPQNGAVFVVFRQPASRPHLVSVAPAAAASHCEIVGRTDTGLRVRLWDRGPWTLTTSDNKQLTVQAEGLPAPQTLDGSWEVRFAPGRGAPESAVFARLQPWNEHPLDGIKYFSGTATYKKTFELGDLPEGQLVRLQLGEVKCVAQVRLNGQPLGVIWTDPWSVDLTPAVRAGGNELEIDVTNLWVNRLIGDAGLPPSQRLTKTNATRRGDETGRLAHLRGYLATDPLQPSGLLGPVQLQFGQVWNVDF